MAARHRRHDALRPFFARRADAGLTAFWHHVTNFEITLGGPDTEQARSFLWQPCVQDGVAHIAAGRYLDTLRRVEGSWRYVSKEVCFNYFVPLSDGWDHGRFTVASAAATYSGRP